MNITVKIAPPDGKWQTACELIKAIAANNPGGDLNFIVEDVFSAGKKTAGNFVANCEFNRDAYHSVVQIGSKIES